MKLKNIDITAFRGVPATRINLDKKNLILLGENGFGKSSIVEAFEFFFTGDLEFRKPQEIRKEHFTTLGFSPDKTKLEFTFENNEILERNLTAFVDFGSKSTELSNFVKNSALVRFILRRKHIIQYIEARPSIRYNEITSLIGLDDLKKAETTFRKVFQHYDNKLRHIENDLFQKEKYLSTHLPKTKDGDFLQRINLFLQQNDVNSISSFQELDNRLKTLIKENPDNSNIIQQFSFLKATKSKLSEGIRLIKLCKKSPLKSHLDDFFQFDKVLITDMEESKQRLSFLIECKKHLHISKYQGICPVCSQSISTSEVDNNIANEIRRLEVKLAQKTEYSQKITILLKMLQDFQTYLSKIILLDIFPIKELDILKMVKKKIEVFDQKIEDIGKPSGNIFKDIESDLNNLDKFLKIQIEGIRKNLLELEPAIISHPKFNLIKTIPLIQKTYQDLIELQKQAEIILPKKKLTEKLLTHFLDVERKKIQEIFTEIQEKVRIFYRMLHPTDDFCNIILDHVDNNKLKLLIDFSTSNGQDPRAYESEGHLDSLAICIFLAYFKTFHNEFPYLILDDVLTSIDSQHRSRYCDLLLSNFPNQQLIITTHDKIWFDYISGHIRAKGQQSKFLEIQIIRWDLEGGLQFKKVIPEEDMIDKLIEDNLMSAAGNQIRILFERILKDFCKMFEFSLKYKENNDHTIGDLFPTIKKQICGLILNEPLKSRVDNLFTKIEAHRWMGNLLSHDNMDRSSITTEEVQIFKELVFSLNKLFICDDCNNKMVYAKELRTIKCKSLDCVCSNQGATKNR
ncbi:DNA replication and repair protein RecF [Candidatus Lokiarchaeum ossiferum]|uniref:DNA replication and repair protein RecF n=1 Tax=Candidatus Lokiarchaeum ossiferum TaxID=2951803 RepID=A0ABY6I1B4_9ARCH|nr:DNA replication and repair protein RecF [Candidatus Lokiarchaeum sp. B-35]